MYTFSIIIPAYNEAQYLPATIAAIRQAEQALGEPVEIIVGDNVSTDATASVAKSLGAKVVPVDIRCISVVRNRAAEQATGKYLVFVDADDHMSRNMLVEIHRVMEAGKHIGGGVARTRYDRRSWGIEFTHGLVQTGLSFTGISMFLFYTTPEAFWTSGAFDADLLCTEDYDFARRLQALGKKRGLKYKNLRTAHLVKSSRKFNEFGDWGVFTRPVLAISAMFASKKAAHTIWYKPRRQGSSEVVQMPQTPAATDTEGERTSAA
ncbi:MAG: glycosyltransferase [Candidatus Hydrogenedentes bacterium]|nr:glycosyltransferase [Candidatus Hydrogenedentota bacterium]